MVDLSRMQRENNFDLLRLGLAWTVVLVHAADLSLAPPLAFLGRWINPQVPVQGFFAISGCLIVASWDRSSSVFGYFRRRAQRILPGYWLALVYTLVLGLAASSLPAARFLASPATWKYTAANLIFANYLHPDLPGVFVHNDLTSVNGALWTIKVEVMFYLFVPLLVWLCRRIGVAWTLGSCFLLSLLYRTLLDAHGHHNLAVQLPGQLSFFLVGAAVYFYFDFFQQHRHVVWTIALLATSIGCTWNLFPLRALGIPLLVLAVAFLLPAVRGVTRFGDFSYGTYVLHFPTIQLLISVGLFARWPWLALCGLVLAVALLAVFSWYAVERHFLRPTRVRQHESEVTTAVA